MAHESARYEHFFVVRWGAPEADDFRRIPEQVRVAEQQAGRKLLYLGIMPEDMPRIDDAARKGFMELTEGIIDHCDKVIVVFEARGFRGAIMRSAMAAVMLLTGRYDKLKFVDCLETAMKLGEDLLPGNRAAVDAALRDVGVSEAA